MKKRIFIMLFTCLIISGCSGYAIGNGGSTAVEETIVIEEDLFNSQDSVYSFTFKTNNKKYLSSKGYTIWSLPKTNYIDSFSMEVELTKLSGKDNMGYGIVFSAFETEQGIKKMQAVLINTNGQYTIGNISNGKFEIDKDWTYTQNLIKGYNTNNIKIIYSDNSNFKLFFNGHEECDFTSIRNNFRNTSYGFVATISPYEDFDSSLVWVEYILK